jgi:hypothetical protein
MPDLGTACCNRSEWLVTFDQKVQYVKGYYADFKRRMAKEEAKAAMEEAASWAASARARSRSYGSLLASRAAQRRDLAAPQPTAAPTSDANIRVKTVEEPSP